jgi:hypothetical protein
VTYTVAADIQQMEIGQRREGIIIHRAEIDVLKHQNLQILKPTSQKKFSKSAIKRWDRSGAMVRGTQWNCLLLSQKCTPKFWFKSIAS